MSSTGIDANTGQLLVGWPHVVQSIGKLLTTEVGSRLERRRVGSVLPKLIDQPQNAEIIMDFYISMAEAMEPRIIEGIQHGEPRFDLERISIDASTAGQLIVLVEGVYYPNGHKGDRTNAAPREISYSSALSDSIDFEAA